MENVGGVCPGLGDHALMFRRCDLSPRPPRFSPSSSDLVPYQYRTPETRDEGIWCMESSLGSMLATLNLSSITSFGNSKAAMRFCIDFPFQVLPPEDEEPLAVCGIGPLSHSPRLATTRPWPSFLPTTLLLGHDYPQWSSRLPSSSCAVLAFPFHLPDLFFFFFFFNSQSIISRQVANFD